MNELMNKTKELTEGMDELMSLMCGQMTVASLTKMSDADFKALRMATKLARLSNEVLMAQTQMFYDMDRKLDEIMAKD